MNKIKVAKSLIHIAKSLLAREEEDKNTWHVWTIDSWGNQDDGWDFNDRSHSWSFECESDDDKEIQKCFEKSLGEHGYDITKLEQGLKYEWDDEEDCNVSDNKTSQPLFQINKEMGW